MAPSEAISAGISTIGLQSAYSTRAASDDIDGFGGERFVVAATNPQLAHPPQRRR
jgi:hypothetical protein